MAPPAPRSPPADAPLAALVAALGACGGTAAVLAAFASWCGAADAGTGAPPPGAHDAGHGLWIGPAGAAARAREGAPAAAMALGLHQARQAEAESEARYHALLEAAFEGICLHIDGELVEVNSALAELYGYRRDEMLGMHVSRLAAPEVLPRIRDIMASGFTGAYETLAVRKNGERVPLEARGKAALWDGQPARVAAFRDLRARKAAEAALVAAREEAVAATRTKSRFLANMSHEIRTPMNGVLGMVQLLLDGPLPPDQRARAEIIRDSAAHLLGILNDILDLSKVEEGRLRIEPRPTVLREVIDGALATVRAGAEQAGLLLELRLDPTLASAWTVDALRLRQVLVNLLGNALRHTKAGRIGVEVERREDGLCFVVRDTGVGMTTAEQEQLFQRFVPVAPSPDARRGAGLGLSISRELVEAMGGAIVAESVVGKGTAVRFHIQARPVPVEPLRGVRVALVGGRPSLGAALRDRGAEVLELAPEALDPLAPWVPDLVHWAGGQPVAGPWLATSPRPWLADATVREVPPSVLAEELLGMLAEATGETAPGMPADAGVLDVLVVEDNVINQLVVGELLGRAGHRVTIAENGEEGVRMALEGRPDLILMDVQMPVMDGLAATRALRRAGYGGPIHALTAHALAEDEAICREAGMDGYMRKPVQVAELGALLSSLGGRVPMLTGQG